MLTAANVSLLLTRRWRTAKTEPKVGSAAPIPLNRVEVTGTSGAYQPANVSQYVSYDPYSAESQSKDKVFVLSIGNGPEDDVERG